MENNMEWIFIGFMVAIGIYLAPLVIGAVVMTVGAIGYGVCRLLGGCK
jgi:hypothetical protein